MDSPTKLVKFREYVTRAIQQRRLVKQSIHICLGIHTIDVRNTLSLTCSIVLRSSRVTLGGIGTFDSSETEIIT